MTKEHKGQFPSKNCECHIQKPYGFVPEADCKEHDTVQFGEFLAEIKRRYLSDIVPEAKPTSKFDSMSKEWNKCRAEILRRIKEKSL